MITWKTLRTTWKGCEKCSVAEIVHKSMKHRINPKNNKIQKNNTSGITGVRYEDKPHARWSAQISNNGKRVKRSFSVQKYGCDEAKKLAINCRRTFEKMV